MNTAMTSGGMKGVETPDRPVSTTPLPGGRVSYPLGGPGAPPAPTPGAPDPGATNPLPGAMPLPRNPDDFVQGR
jgi:hypothetical protein